MRGFVGEIYAGSLSGLCQIRFIDKCLTGVIEKTRLLPQVHHTILKSVVKLAKSKVNFDLYVQKTDEVTYKFNT